MTALAERVQVDDITARARQARPGRAVLTAIAAILFGLGWLAGRMVFALAWCAVAVRVGWQEGRGNAVSRGAA